MTIFVCISDSVSNREREEGKPRYLDRYIRSLFMAFSRLQDAMYRVFNMERSQNKFDTYFAYIWYFWCILLQNLVTNTIYLGGAHIEHPVVHIIERLLSSFSCRDAFLLFVSNLPNAAH